MSSPLGVRPVLYAAVGLAAAVSVLYFVRGRDPDRPEADSGSVARSLAKQPLRRAHGRIKDIVDNGTANAVMVLRADLAMADVELTHGKPGNQPVPFDCLDDLPVKCASQEQVPLRIHLLEGAWDNVDVDDDVEFDQGHSIIIALVTNESKRGTMVKGLDGLHAGESAYWTLTRDSKAMPNGGSVCGDGNAITSRFYKVERGTGKLVQVGGEESFCRCKVQIVPDPALGLVGRWDAMKHCATADSGKIHFQQLPPAWMRCKNGCCISQAK